jgi:hypothetical protein
MQNKSKILLIAGIMAGILLISGCSDVFQGSQEEVPSAGGAGRVTITIDAGARTLLPQAAEFSRFEVTIAQQGGSTVLEPVAATGGTADLVLPQGVWDVQVLAYNQGQPAAIVAHAENTLTNTGGEVTGNTRFVLEPAGTGPGVLAYRISVPAGIALDANQSRIQIEQNGLTVQTIAISGSAEGKISLEPGRYIVDVLLDEAGSDKRAGQRETVVILPGLTTAVAFAPEGLVESVDTLTFSSVAEYRAYIETLPENTKENPYRISLTGIDLQDLWEGHDPLGQVVSVLGWTGDRGSFSVTEAETMKGRYIALDLSGCTGTAMGSLDDPTHMEPAFNPAYDPRPLGQYGAAGSIDANFMNRGRVVSVTLPESLESIGDFVFIWCSSLESVVLPESLKFIGHGAFWGSGLTSVEIPDSVERIGIRAFAGVAFVEGPLKSVKLPASLKEIPLAAFQNQGLSSIELPQDLEVIGRSAFGGNISLRSISFPDTLTTLGDAAFGTTKQLESITLPASLTTLGYMAFHGSGLTSVDMSACVALEYTDPHATSPFVGSSYAFDECLSLTEVKLPPNLKELGDSTFRDCSSLKVLDLPASVESIHIDAVEGGVHTLVIRSIEPPQVHRSRSSTNLTVSVIYVPDGSIEKYKAATGYQGVELRKLSEYQG